MKKAIFLTLLLLVLSSTPLLAQADATSTDTAAAVILSIPPSDATTTAATTTPPSSGAGFHATQPDVVSDSAAVFAFAAADGFSYTISFQCPLGISAPVAADDLCKTTSNIGSFKEGSGTFEVHFKNEATTEQTVTAILIPSDSAGNHGASEKALIVIKPPVALRASIASFAIEERIVEAASIPSIMYTAQFTGRNVDAYHVRLRCARPMTVAGIRERLALIMSGGSGSVTSPSGATDLCNKTQTAAASVSSYSFRFQNSFTTPQLVTVELQAYGWDGEKEVFGEAQSKEIIVNAR